MEVISKVQNKILGLFGEVLESEHFYLTGGTALAEFYLKHRKSDDLDFFTATEELIIPFSNRLEEMLRTKGMDVQRKRGLHSFVELLVRAHEETTVVHLAEDTPFRFEHPKRFPEYPRLRVDSLVDISSNKLLALFSRATLRDFIDIYVLVKKGLFTPEKLIESAKVKDSGFDLYWLGVAFERIKTFKDDSSEMLLLVEPIKFHEVLLFFNQWREKIAEEL
ncbi:MAG: nucleotidyl transferase AbiEii/AbiGii toxin family protein [Candidatus Omnitrophica bacterium]|nr:nucleotidyl transferase AbiEii/AbiGii toxin family protein [Candidatus Omnitrophota bacterium]